MPPGSASPWRAPRTPDALDLVQKPRMYMRGYAGSSAFTLTELLIVIGIIVLFVTLALPAFNLISGGKSIAGAENQISALLSQARAEAVGVQDYRGLAIYRDAATDRYGAAIVNFVTYSTWNAATTYQQYSYVTYTPSPGPSQVTYYFVATTFIQGNASNPTPPAPNSGWSQCGPNAMDLESGAGVQSFPTGVGVQVINNGSITNAGARASNGYLPIGVVLFNGSGVMTLKTVAIATSGNLGTIGSFAAYFSSPAQGSIPYYGATTASPHNGLDLSSSFGFVAYDKQTFDGQNFYSGLPSQLTTQTPNNGTNPNYNGQEQAADKWLDANSTPLLINRYNGTLVRSE